MKKKAIIVCNGAVGPKVIRSLKEVYSVKRKEYFIIAADGGSVILYVHRLLPDMIAGDLDSISPDVYKYFKRKKVKIKEIAEQEHTDLEKCLNIVLSKKLKDISVIAFAGERPDHTLNNFSIIKRYLNKAEIKMYDEKFEMYYIKKTHTFDYKKGEVVSMLGMPRAEGVRTYGLKYPLDDETLEFSVREGCLNESSATRVKIELKKGALLVFKKHFGKMF